MSFQEFHRLGKMIKRQIDNSENDVRWYLEIDVGLIDQFNFVATELFSVEPVFDIHTICRGPKRLRRDQFNDDASFKRSEELFFEQLEHFSAIAEFDTIRRDTFYYRSPFDQSERLSVDLYMFQKDAGSTEWQRVVRSFGWEEEIKSKKKRLIGVIDDWLEFADMEFEKQFAELSKNERVIYDVYRNSDGPLTGKDVEGLLKQSENRLSYTTIKLAVGTLKEKGLLRYTKGTNSGLVAVLALS